MLRNLFGKKKEPVEGESTFSGAENSSLQSETAIWEMLQADWICVQGHTGAGKPMDIAAHAPDPFPQDWEYEPNSSLKFDEDFLSEDFCILNDRDKTHYFIRAVMEFPVVGTDEIWCFGCWSTLSADNFDKYLDGFDAGVYPAEEPWFGWLCNRLIPVFAGTEPLPLAVQPKPNRERPRVKIRDEGHPLAIYQTNGLPPSVILEILSAYGLGPKTN